ncbi:hypothetical protein [Citrobacter sp. JGM124]|uniref:hypothetical protein n=1 Tax=Citrobacter sp. JGM124 TaxID=2799789 RepID=UPI001BA7F06B|nr:hypothetical protein [Citrobacter sp. JGM124]MBS0847263.1 hypothetical protein [Citrobacter sp. JGM124]
MPGLQGERYSASLPGKVSRYHLSWYSQPSLSPHFIPESLPFSDVLEAGIRQPKTRMFK